MQAQEKQAPSGQGHAVSSMAGAARADTSSQDRRKRRSFSKEYKSEVVRLAKEGTKSIPQLAHDLGIGEVSIRQWLRQAEIDAVGNGQSGPLTSEERAEFQRLRRENRQLKMEREILKKATAFFAREKA